jgi:hypothetical protein
LDDIAPPPRGTPVVIDLSSLITLHQLELLDAAAEYFGKLLMPSQYLTHVLSNSSRLGFHQLSRKSAAEELAAALDAGQVTVAVDGGAGLPHVHEHTADDEPGEFYRLRDVAAVLHGAGRIPEKKFQDLLKVAHRPSRTDATHPPLRLGEPVLFQLHTLRTLSQMDALAPMLNAFTVKVTAADRNEIVSDMRAVSSQSQARERHNAIWKAVRANPRIVQTAIAAPLETKPGSDTGDAEDDRHLPMSLAAPFIARSQDIPLLADDRVCQVFALGHRPSDPHAAFSTDRLIQALHAEGLLDAEATADKLLQLVAWRYRFIVLPPTVLLTLAKRYPAHPLGADLERVGRYIHDCMRDTGLFGGLE